MERAISTASVSNRLSNFHIRRAPAVDDVSHGQPPRDVEAIAVRMDDEIDSAWRDAEYDDALLPEVACAAIDGNDALRALDVEQLVRWALTTPRLARQFDLPSAFSNMALTVAHGDRFHIDLLFWLDGVTSIHQHSFWGAFHVLAGSSIHTRYAFSRAHAWSQDVVAGELSVDTTELLGRGDSRPILGGSRLIHSLYHLDKPSVTLVVRTRGAGGPQYTYERSGLAYDPFLRNERLEKALQTLDVVWRLEHPNRFEWTRDFVRAADAATLVQLALRSPRLAPAVDDQDAIVAMVAERDPRLHALLRNTLRDRRRETMVLRRRGQAGDRDHRFLLGTMLTCADREQVDALVRQRCGAAAPATICAWLEQMSTIARRDAPDSNLLGFELNEVSAEVLRCLVHERTADETIDLLLRPGDEPECRGQLRSIYEALRSSSLLAPLFLRRTNGNARFDHDNSNPTGDHNAE